MNEHSPRSLERERTVSPPLAKSLGSTYTTPRLVVHGDAAAITQAINDRGADGPIS